MKIAHSSTSNSNSHSVIRDSLLIRGMLVILVLFLSLWFIPRLLPIHALCKRGLECALLYPEDLAPFRKNVRIERESVCGDLVSLSGNESLCYPRAETFETDELGFRNNPGSLPENSEVILLGDSFGFGQGLDQPLIPSNQLAKALNRSVYNGAGRLDFDAIEFLSKKAGPGKTFVFLDLDRSKRGPSDLESSRKNRSQRLFKMYRSTFKNYNPLKILITRLDQSLLGPILPKNQKTVGAIEIQTHTSKPYLFLNPYSNRGQLTDTWMNDRIGYFQKLDRYFKSQSQNLFLVLIPEKTTVYLDEGPTRAESLNTLSDSLNRAGVSTISIAKDFIEAARVFDEKTSPLYYPDDTHWSPRGVQVLAQKLGADQRLKRPSP